MSGYFRLYETFPRDMFRINRGHMVRLRAVPGPIRPLRNFDLMAKGGLVKPKALNLETYEAPNGATMHPNTKTFQKLLTKSKGNFIDPIIVYGVQKGTELPDDLILVCEARARYSLQAKKEMTVDELNTKITDFFSTKGKSLTKPEWQKIYPKMTTGNLRAWFGGARVPKKPVEVTPPLYPSGKKWEWVPFPLSKDRNGPLSHPLRK